MNILSISPFVGSYPVSPFGGGKGKFAFTFNSYLVDERGFDVCIVPWKERVGGEFKQTTLGGNYFVIEGVYDHNWLRGWKYWLKSRFRPLIANRLQRLREIIDKYDPALVHLHYTLSDFPEAFRLLHLEVPLVMTAHSGLSQQNFGRAQIGLLYSDAVVFVSKSSLEFVSSNYPAVSRKARIIHYSASKVFTESPALPNTRDSITFVGVLNSNKNLETLIRALARLRDEKLVVCGDGPDRDGLEQLCNTLDLAVVFCGHVPEEDLRDKLSQAKMLVVPSYREGFAITYVEALCCGTPIIGFPPNVMEHEELLGCKVGYPFYAETQNDSDLAELIDTLRRSELIEPEYRNMLSKRARSYFSEERAFGEYISLYKQLVRDSAG